MKTQPLAINYIDKITAHKFYFPITIFKKPANPREYAKLEKVLDNLIDEVKGNDKHPLAIIMQIIGDNLEYYDNEHFASFGKDIDNIEKIKYLMKSNNLHQKDLASIFGSQANVSKFLNGERSLSKAQIIKLKTRFGISADFFL